MENLKENLLEPEPMGAQVFENENDDDQAAVEQDKTENI
jgi:hypothetical protein